MLGINQDITSKIFDNPKTCFTGIGFFLVLVLGFIDSQIDYRVSFSIFYVLPVVLVTWYAGIRIGILFSIFCSAMWFMAALLSHEHRMPIGIVSWNSVVRLGFFIIISSVLHYFKSERENARVDFLTRIPNRRHFEEQLSAEIQRSSRYGHPLSIVYMDIDNFKSINDNLGHHAGDQLLASASAIIRRAVRSTDVVARLGGDEFAFILIETGEAEAKKFIQKILYELLLTMESQSWPVTFSFGIATFHSFKNTASEMMRIADTCMYRSKKAGKNRISVKVIR